MNSIQFTHNWNQKLGGDIFTTIRKSKDDGSYYRGKVGCGYNVILGESVFCSALLIDCLVMPFEQIPELVLLLDTGTTNRKAAEAVFEKFYGPTFDRKALFSVLLFKRLSYA